MHYINALDSYMGRKDIDMILLAVPDDEAARYNAVKLRLLVEKPSKSSGG